MIVLWVLVILSLIAWGLGRRSSIEVSLLETYRGKVRSYAAARAGINILLDLLQRKPSTKDTLYATGITIDQGKTPEALFSHIDTGQNAYAIVQWPAKNFSQGASAALEYGIRDEEGRININAINLNNYQILSALLQLKGLSQQQADQLVFAIINYTGNGNSSGQGNSFMTDDNQEGSKPKNRPYENILELLEVDGMTQDVFDQIKEDITVYGDSQNGLWIDTDTANNDVIQAVANAAARTNPSVNAADIVTQAYAIRDGADGQSFSADDGATSITTLNDPNWPGVLQEGRSNYYRTRVVGVDGDSGTRTVLEVVIHQTAGSPGEILSWQRD